MKTSFIGCALFILFHIFFFQSEDQNVEVVEKEDQPVVRENIASSSENKGCRIF